MERTQALVRKQRMTPAAEGRHAYSLTSRIQKLTFRLGNQVTFMLVVVTVCCPVM
jgi:hypothetical protein